MISIVLSKSVDKSNTKYYDVVIKWLNVTTLIVNIYKTHTLYCDVAIKWYFITNLFFAIVFYVLLYLLRFCFMV